VAELSENSERLARMRDALVSAMPENPSLTIASMLLEMAGGEG